MKKKVLLGLLIVGGMLSSYNTVEVFATELVSQENDINGWHYEGSDAYYYIDGVMQTGWINDGYDDYFLDKETGVMQTGWIHDGYDDYFLDKETGVMQTGWIHDGYDDYFLDKETGVMQTGWIHDGYDDYFLDKETGVMQTGWIHDGYDDYFLDKETGVMQTGWINDGYDDYFLDKETGVMQTGWKNTQDGYYYLDAEDGNMLTGRHTIGGLEYWLNDNGIMKYDEWIGHIYISASGVVKEITREDCNSDLQYNMFMDMTSLSNREAVHQEAINLHNGITNNNCVFFLSEVLRRAGVNIPDHIGYTTKLEAQLVNKGWKKRTDLINLKPGDIVYAGNKYGYTHVYLFMGWAENGYAYVVDNQKSAFGEVLHKRNVFEKDKIDDTDYSINYYTYN